MFLVDTEQGRIIEDEEIKQKLAAERPYREWLNEHLVHLERPAPPPRSRAAPDHETLLQRQIAFGYTTRTSASSSRRWRATASRRSARWATTRALAVLSNKPRLLYDYFKQLFAQVTNPPIDCIREEIIISAETRLGSEGNLLNPQPSAAAASS
jgi:hypothetical protein